MVARSAGCEQQVLSTASLAASSNRDPHYVRLITDDATDFASKIRCFQKQSYSKLYSLTVPVSLRDYFSGCYRADTSVCPYNNKNHCKSNSSLKAKGLRGAPQRVRQAMLGKAGDMFERSESLNGPSTCDIRRAARHEATEECRK